MSLPAEYLDRAEEMARAEHVTLSTVISRALAIGLTPRRSPEEVRRSMESYRKAFIIPGISEDDLLMLEGIFMEPFGPDNPDPDEDIKQ